MDSNTKNQGELVFTERLAKAVIGVFKIEEIQRRCSWKWLEDFEFATREWVAWFNTCRLLEPVGYLPPRGV